MDPLLFAGSRAESKNENTLQAVMLKDVHPFYGGQNLYLRRDGTGFCQVVTWKAEASGFYEQRYRIALSSDSIQHLADLIKSHSFFQLSTIERAGLPDEARPTISVTLISGKSLSISKWANDKHPDFDVIYEALLEYIQAAKLSRPLYEGTYNHRWVPDGFVSQ